MTTCPRCKEDTLHEKEVLNALSRRDNKTYICNDCGDEEAFSDAGFIQADETESNFIATLQNA